APSTASSREPPIRMSAPASSPPEPIRIAATTVITRPMTVTVLAVRWKASARRTMGSRTARTVSLTHAGKSESPRGRPGARGWLADIGNLRAACRSSGPDTRRARDESGLSVAQLLEGGQAELVQRLSSVARGGDHAREPQDPQVPADQRLRQA